MRLYVLFLFTTNNPLARQSGHSPREGEKSQYVIGIYVKVQEFFPPPGGIKKGVIV